MPLSAHIEEGLRRAVAQRDARIKTVQGNDLGSQGRSRISGTHHAGFSPPFNPSNSADIFGRQKWVDVYLGFAASAKPLIYLTRAFGQRHSKRYRHVMKEREEHRTLDLDGQARERLILWIRRRMEEFGITLEALEAALIADAAVPKYRDAFGHEWDGTGDRPDWLTRAINAGQDIEHFRV
jgi:DNA-binding protein H-NS